MTANLTALPTPGAMASEPRKAVRSAIGALSHLDGLLSDTRRLPDAIHNEVRTWVGGMLTEAERLIALVEPHVAERRPRGKSREKATS
jgi:hypothetical protein